MSEDFKGKAKEAFGAAKGDEGLKEEGQAQQRKAEARKEKEQKAKTKAEKEQARREESGGKGLLGGNIL
jgi:uncharacterized protein YjbJ (UPF0337 family)